MKTIEEEWQGFSSMIFAKMKEPPCAVQIEETKRAFFAGAWMILCAVKRIGEPDISEEDGFNYLESVHREGEQFYRDLIKRYAEGN